MAGVCGGLGGVNSRYCSVVNGNAAGDAIGPNNGSHGSTDPGSGTTTASKRVSPDSANGATPTTANSFE